MALAFANGEDHVILSTPEVDFPLLVVTRLYRQCFGVERVGKHPLQGFHLVISAFPLSLYNTCLQLLDKTLTFVPVDFRPES